MVSAQQNPTLPVDEKVRTGKLENGLTYYIRHNKTPENRADFYIAQKVGSMQEEDNQAGLAHFLEHMAFNGTTNFPGKQMLTYLQDKGIKFGTNINAYTSFDETVYYVSDVPTTDQNLVDSVMLVLYDWSCGIALQEEEIDNERGVITEEWRTRGGAQSRLWDQLLPKMFPNSKYANRMPIGSIDVIQNFKPEEIRAYYHKWYRPDLQGIIIVGDIDVDATEAKLKEMFSKVKLDENVAERVYFPVPDNEEPIVAIATDKEATNTQIMMFYKHEAMPDELKNTQAGLVKQYLTNVAAEMMNQRFNEITEKPDAPFLYAEAYDGDYFMAKTKDAWTVMAASAEDKIADAIATLKRETLRVKQHGFTAAEYEVARTNLMKEVEDAYNNRDKQQNRSYASQYVSAFTDGEPIPGIEFEHQFIQMLAPNIPVEAINLAIQELITDKNMVIGITGPEKEGLVYPTEEALLATLAAVGNEKIEPYVGVTIDEPLVANPPKAGKIVKEEKDETLGATVWTLQNGMKVILKSTDFKDDQILMTASSFGGYAQYAESDPINAKLMSQFMNVGGVGNFSATDLPKVLAGKTASAVPTIGLTTQGFSGSSSIKDFETMLQLVYLYFTAPRQDNEAFKSNIQRLETMLKNSEADPMNAFADAAIASMYGDNPLTNRVKSEDLAKVDYDAIMRMYKQQFFNPGNFVFTFVGNIDEAKVRPVVEQYLASLKGQDVDDTFTKVPMATQKGEVRNKFERAMQNPKASVFGTVTGNIEYNLRNNILMSVFDQILDIVFTEKVREDEGGTYGVSSSGSIARYPENQAILQIMYDTNAEKVDHLNQIIIREIKNIADNGVRKEDFTKVIEYMNKSYNENLRENGYWRNVLSTKYTYNDDTHTTYLDTLNSITMEDVRVFVKNFIEQGNNGIVVMVPETETK